MLQLGAADLGSLLALELWRTEVRLQRRTPAAHGAHDVLEKLYVRIVCTSGEGWGEVAALATPVGVDPSLGAVAQALEGRWSERLFVSARARGGRCPESSALGLLGASSVLDHVTAASLEMAVLDAELRSVSRSLAEHLEATGPSVRFGGLVGLPDDGRVADSVAWAASLLEGGATRLRVKIDEHHPVLAVLALREAFPDVALHADANGAFDPRSLELLRPLDELGLVCIEQPLAGRDLAAMASAAASFTTPWCLDEAITSRRQARDAVRYGAAQALCIKPGRVGGLRTVLGIGSDAAASSVPAFIGGLFETGLGRAALGALSARPEYSLVSDVGAPVTYLEEDPCELAGPSGGLQPLWDGPGVGPWPRRSALSPVFSRRF